AFLILLWIKPLWSRLIQAPAGVLLFEPGAEKEVIFRQLLQGLKSELFSYLTWKRFSFFGALLLPLGMFEMVPRNSRAGRRSWLPAGLGGKLFGLTVICLTLETVLFFSILYLLSQVGSVVPMGVETESAISINTPGVFPLCYALASLVVEPLF